LRLGRTAFLRAITVLRAFGLIAAFCIVAKAQTATYHLHKEASAINTSFDQLKTSGPDAAITALTTVLTNKAAGDYVIKEFETQTGVPNAAGIIPSGSTFSFSLYMRKTANVTGVTVKPEAKLKLNSATGTTLCSVTGSTALTTTITLMNFSCSTAANASMTATDRFYLWVGVNISAASSSAYSGELDIEGTLNGNFDSKITATLPTPAPTISNISPNGAAIGSAVVISGTNFGSVQGNSTVTFNGIASIPSTWSATSITTQVPAGATSGPVVVTVNGQASAGAAFTVLPGIAALSPNSGVAGSSITITGSNFGATQGSVTFNGTAGAITSWADQTIVAKVPAGATAGNIVVATAAGAQSAGAKFTVFNPGTSVMITSLSAVAGALGSLLTITGVNFGSTAGTVTINGTTATVTSWSTSSIVVTVPSAATTGNVVATVNGQTSNGLRFIVTNSAGLAVDQVVSGHAALPPPLSTTSGNELLLAFVSSGTASTTQNTFTVSGLTWTLVKRTNTQNGTAEIWRAFSPFILTNYTAPSGTSFPAHASVTLVSYLGVDISGTNGSAAIGATGTANASSAAPSVALTSTRANSFVFGVGDDPSGATARTLGANQTMVDQFLDGSTDALWAQRVTGSVANSGTSVTLNDTAPTNHAYNLSAVEIVPSPVPVITSLSPSAGPVGAVVTISGSNFGATQGSSTVTFAGITASTTWGNISIAATVPNGAPLGSVPVVVTTVNGASNPATFTVVASLSISATVSSAIPPLNNWYRSDVTISYQCSGGVAPLQCPASQTITSQGSDQQITGTVTDATGQTKSVVTHLNIDKTVPTIAATVVPAPVKGVVTLPANGPVLVSFTCADTLSGVATCPAAIPVTAVGANQSFSGMAVDVAGNSSAPATVTFSVQSAPLTASASLSPAPNAAGWNNTNVTVSFQGSGGVPPLVTSPPQVIGTEGANQSVTGSVTDAAGQVATKTVSVSVDKTPPTITATITPTPVNGVVTIPTSGAVTVSFTCSDALSGVATCPADIPVTTVGPNQSFSGTAKDNAGNTSTPVNVTFSVQATPLIASASISPAPNAAGWNNTDVTVSFQGSGGVPPLAPSASQVVSAEGANQSVTGSVTDAAGQVVPKTVSVSVDKTAPTIATTVMPAPVNGVVTIPPGGAVTVSFTCSDALSGVATCQADIPVTTVGANQSFSGIARDNAGNTSTPASVTLNVQAVPLSITATVSSLIAPTNNWYRTDVNINYQCSGGIPPLQCPPSQPVSSEGLDQQITATVTDAAGQSASTTTHVNIDKTPPTISATVTPAPVNGVVTLPAGGAITVSFTCADTLSGIATCPADISVTSVGATQSFSGTTVDQAGNSSDPAAVILNVQAAPLAITASASPAANAAGWNHSDVTVSFSCTGGAPPLQCPPPRLVNTEAGNQNIAGTVIDGAGQSATASVPINLDETAPQVSITSMVTGTISARTLSVSGSLSDALSGVAAVTCNGNSAVFSVNAFACDLPLASGANPILVQATDIAGNIGSASSSINVVNGPNFTITSPTPLALFPANPITITGTVDDPQATVTANGVTGTVSGNTFTITGVNLHETKNLLTVTATNLAGGISTATATVFLDTTPPDVHIASPADGAVVTSSPITVMGSVNDLVSGTVNGDQISVTVNGVQADVENRSFAAQNVALLPGDNNIIAVATDKAGNVSQHQVHVTLVDPSIGQHLVIISGNSQTATVSTLLAQPLVVQAVDALGRPISNRTINFHVSRSDGTMAAFPQSGRDLNLQTDANGQASVQFQLGSRVGAGINQVMVTAPGFVGQTVFYESSTVGSATQIRPVSGEIQKGAAGSPLPEPLVAIVTDAGGNPVANASVTFTVVAGGGAIGGSTSVTKTTDPDGKVSAVLTLAQEEGINNNAVVASINGATNSGISFVSSGVVTGPAALTTVSGIVLDNAEQPIPNATVTIKGTNTPAVTTNDQGQFTIQGAPTGDIVLYVDGSTSTRPERFPTLSFQMATLPGINNTLSGPIYLPPLDSDNSQEVGGDQDVVLTMKGVPGVAHRIFAHSVRFPDGSTTGQMMVTQVHADRVPMIPLNGSAPTLVATLQPAGVSFDPPVQLQVPNTEGLAPGNVIEIFGFRHDLEQFVSEGTARVSDDGSVIVSDPGSGLRVAGWFFIPGGPGTPTCASGCGICQFCRFPGGSCVANPLAGPCADNCIVGTGTCGGGTCNGNPKQINDLTITASDPDANNPVDTPDKLVKIVRPSQPALQLDFTANVNSKQNCDDIVYDWDFGDGAKIPGQGNKISHVYNISYAGQKLTVKVTARCGACTRTPGERDTKMIVAFARIKEIETNAEPVINPAPFQGIAQYQNPPFKSSSKKGDDTQDDTGQNPPVGLPVGLHPLQLQCITEPDTKDRDVGSDIKALIQWQTNPVDTARFAPNGEFATLKTTTHGSFSASCFLDANGDQQRDPDEPRRVQNFAFVAVTVNKLTATGHKDNIHQNRLTFGDLTCVPQAATPDFTKTTLEVCTGGNQIALPDTAGIFMDSQEKLIGGGKNGTDGVNDLTVGFVQNVTDRQIGGNYGHGNTVVRTSQLTKFFPGHKDNIIFCDQVPQPASFPILDTNKDIVTGGATVLTLGNIRDIHNDPPANTDRESQFIDSPSMVFVTNLKACGVDENLLSTKGTESFRAALIVFNDSFPGSYVVLGTVDWSVTFDGTGSFDASGDYKWARSSNYDITATTTTSGYPKDGADIKFQFYAPVALFSQGTDARKQ
jgi:hypothetical protein